MVEDSCIIIVGNHQDIEESEFQSTLSKIKIYSHPYFLNIEDMKIGKVERKRERKRRVVEVGFVIVLTDIMNVMPTVPSY